MSPNTTRQEPQEVLPIVTSTDKLRQAITLWFAPLVLFCVTLLLYLHEIDRLSLWIDEGYSLYDATQLSYDRIVMRPVYYWFLHWWNLIGDGVTWGRSFSALLGSATIALQWWVVNKAFGRTAALISCLGLALVPQFVQQSQSLRMYTLSTALTVGGSLALLTYFQQLRMRWLLTWGLLRATLWFTTPLAAVLLVVEVLAVLLMDQTRRPSRRAIITVGACIGLAGLPLYIQNHTMVQDFLTGWISRRDPPSLADYFTMMLQDLPFGSDYAPPLWKWETNINVIAAAFLVAAAIYWFRHKQWFGLFFASAFLPPALIWLASQVTGPLWIHRYVLFTIPFVMVILALGLQAIWMKSRLISIAIAMLLGTSAVHSSSYQYKRSPSNSWKNVAQQLRREVRPGDQIAFHRDLPANYAITPYFSLNETHMFSEYGTSGNGVYFVDRFMRTAASRLVSDEDRLLFVYRASGYVGVHLFVAPKQLVLDPRSAEEKCRDGDLTPDQQHLYCNFQVIFHHH